MEKCLVYQNVYNEQNKTWQKDRNDNERSLRDAFNSTVDACSCSVEHRYNVVTVLVVYSRLCFVWLFPPFDVLHR